MPLEIVVTTGRWRSDPTSRSLVDYLKGNEASLGLSSGIVYYDFPAYADYEASLFRPDVLLFSPDHGFVAIRTFDGSLFQRSREQLSEIDLALDDFSSNLLSRLIRSRELRQSRSSSIVRINPVIFIASGDHAAHEDEELESVVCASLDALGDYLDELRGEAIPPSAVAEVRSVVEGAKALARPAKRIVDDAAAQPLAAAMAKIENEIANFDQKQRFIALVDVGGPARIRGLAGTGKTVILAMKAAHLHLNNPEQTIAFTFYTKSLRATIKSLITRFYRIYSDTDPNWKRIQIRHGWGGATVPGIYSDAAQRANRAPLKLPEAKAIARRKETPFAAACSDLLQSRAVRPYYDHFLIDEGQDFPDSFYQLAYQLTKGEQDTKSITWAYDELQDILNVKIRAPSELFGVDEVGRPVVDLDRSMAHVPPGATNDAVLSKAYRNQRDVLVVAHALGFGIYGEIVQMLESSDHWEDVGYTVETGKLVVGNPVRVRRSDANSPLFLPATPGFPLIDTYVADDLKGEVENAVALVESFISGGLEPEEVLVIAMDDRHAKRYLSAISEGLSLRQISSNNVIADPYNEPPFTISGKVTLSTVYRAKGNEAAAVIAVGVDAVETKSRDGRNKLFTAFTRSKAWLRVSGMGAQARAIVREIKKATAAAPEIAFTMPDLDHIDTIQRGFSKKQAAARLARAKYLESLRAAGLSEEEIEEELQQGSFDE